MLQPRVLQSVRRKARKQDKLPKSPEVTVETRSISMGAAEARRDADDGAQRPEHQGQFRRCAGLLEEFDERTGRNAGRSATAIRLYCRRNQPQRDHARPAGKRELRRHPVAPVSEASFFRGGKASRCRGSMTGDGRQPPDKARCRQPKASSRRVRTGQKMAEESPVKTDMVDMV